MFLSICLCVCVHACFAAPFLFQVPPFLAAFKEAWEYLDIVVGNESEAEAMGQAFGFAGQFAV
jgi:sugar/nucleoside kinase (ribokinase family)